LTLNEQSFWWINDVLFARKSSALQRADWDRADEIGRVINEWARILTPERSRRDFVDHFMSNPDVHIGMISSPRSQ
jgi:hypothetical protein